MEFFKKAKAVRLRSHHSKYMIGDEDEYNVKQSRTGSSKSARWSVELIPNKPNVIRLKNSQTWTYLAAGENPFLLGFTGKHVVQAPPRLVNDPSVEWEPIKDGSHVKLRSRRGTFLRANAGIYPYNSSITHDDVPGGSRQGWILWAVDVLEVDHEAESIEEVTVGSNVEDHGGGAGSFSRTSSCGSTISKADYYKDCNEVAPPVASNGHVKPSSADQGKHSVYSSNTKEEDEGLSKTSSSPSNISKADYYKDTASPKPVKSVRRPTANQNAAQNSRPSTKAPEKPKLSPHVQHVRDESQNSVSFNKLSNALDGIGDLIDDDDDQEEYYTESGSDSDTAAETKIHKPHALEVQMAKHTLHELKSLDFENLLSSSKDEKLLQAVGVLITDAKMSGGGQVPDELADLEDKLKTMREERDSATQEMEEFTSFSTKRTEMRVELKKDAAKAHELQALEAGLGHMLATARTKREELLKQLADVESSIAATEKAQSDNADQIEELISSIGQRSETLREMEKKEKTWQTKKVEAERTLERVEEDWVKMQSLFQEF